MSVFRKCLILNLKKKYQSTSVVTIFLRNQANTSNINNNYLISDAPTIEIPKNSLFEYIFSNIDRWPNHIATECAITGRKYAYQDLYNNAINLNCHLRKRFKLQKGDVIALLLPNCPEFAISIMGAIKSGIIITTINPIYTPEEISRQLIDSSSKAIITLVDLWDNAKKSINLAQKNIPILTIKTKQNQALPVGSINFNEFIEKIDYPNGDLVDYNDIAFLPYSSGTTGLPKGVQLTHFNMLSNLIQFDNYNICNDTTETHQDILPAILPKFHIYGLMASLFYLLKKGCKSVDLPNFTPETYVKTLRNYKPNVLFVAPPIILFLTGHPMVKTEDLDSIETVVSGAAPLGALDEEKFQTKSSKNLTILQGYGLTECSPVVTMTSKNIKLYKNSSGTIGRPVLNTLLKVVGIDDPTETHLGPNKVGELFVKGPQVMKGYHNRPKETKEIFTKDNWLKTGDMVYYNEDNLLFISDRLKELIKVKGYQVAPAELEEIIRDYPDVDDAAVIGIPHVSQGEVPRAYITVKPNKKINLYQLNEFVTNKVAKYKQLKGGIEIVNEIPKNSTGKILRRQLKLQYEKNLK